MPQSYLVLTMRYFSPSICWDVTIVLLYHGTDENGPPVRFCSEALVYTFDERYSFFLIAVHGGSGGLPHVKEEPPLSCIQQSGNPISGSIRLDGDIGILPSWVSG